MEPNLIDASEAGTPLIPSLRVRAGRAMFDLHTLEEALAFASVNPHPKGDYDGLIRRLQAADTPDEIVEASNAFQWWAETNQILVGPEAALTAAP
ncbi:hypothetical protein MWN34_06720 [Ancylobacter sp. 6x-1]|uniref:Uncharacterized protein n=1 Tax=Ancylobacter crimeensis TaxID=2579147 RepID=A0ABT0D9H5_9HYPH|nr:hypothetical protein [Ancylobacter crimeensis]MCK0196605.1 hypothetical protein [Ancylobacter crimeensis]